MSYTLPLGDVFHVGTFIKTTSAQTIEILGGSGVAGADRDPLSCRPPPNTV